MGNLVGVIPVVVNAGADRHDLKTSLEKVLDTWLEMGTNEEVSIVLPEF
jgi:hypothetical protein